MNSVIQSGKFTFTQLEMNDPGGSHKYRPAKFIIESALKKGDVIPGVTTIIEKTGGNFGLGLLPVCNLYKIPVELAVGLNFSRLKRELLECFGATLIGLDMLATGSSPKEVIAYHLKNQVSLGKTYYYTDQFANHAAIDAHRYQTAAELSLQLRKQGASNTLIFLGCAGTGASFTGITLGLKDHGFDVSTMMVEPTGCDSRAGVFSDHRLEGAAVGVCPPFLDWSLVDARRQVGHEEMLAAQRQFYLQSGIFVGNTSAACLAIAYQLEGLACYEGTTLVTIAYDGGLWYQDLRKSLTRNVA